MTRSGMRARLLADRRVATVARSVRLRLERLAMPTADLREWHDIDGDRTLRLDYDLGPDSLVIDAGGYEGQWASDIVARYGCRVHVFEPVPAYAERIRSRFARNPLVTVHAAGLAPAPGVAQIGVAGDASSHAHAAGSEMVEIALEGIDDVAARAGGSQIDLLKLNIEGAEYELLDHMLETGLIEQVVDLQVQFHSFVPDADARVAAIRRGLGASHRPTYSYDFLWENWLRVAP